jgi:threonine synthase
LDVVVEPSLTPGNLRAEEASLWRYRDAIPVEDEKAIVSLGEGMTPLLEAVLDGVRILLKAEYLSPTGSFKDRGASVLLSRLKEMRVEEILEDSSGNAGCSMAAYAAAAGIKCRVLVPENVPQEKAIQIASYGAILERIPGSRDDVAEIFYPVGNGSLILGSLKGCSEMKALGWIDEIPRLIGVQVVSHAPVYTRVTGDKPQSVGDHTIAKGIAVRKPVRLQQIADAIRSTAGTVVTIEDSQIRVAQRDLARAGFLVEPTSATALAGYRVWKEGGEEGERVLLPLTGWGLKDIVSLEELSDEEAG